MQSYKIYLYRSNIATEKIEYRRNIVIYSDIFQILRLSIGFWYLNQWYWTTKIIQSPLARSRKEMRLDCCDKQSLFNMAGGVRDSFMK